MFSQFSERIRVLPYPQITTFPDASYGALRDSGSVESACVLFGVPFSRDGTALCRGHLLTWYTRRIHRVCRSTANSECVALNSAVDLTIYLQVVLAELLTGRYDVEFLTRTSILPMMNPFKPSPSHVQIQQEFQAADPSSLRTRIVSTNLSVSWGEKSDFALHSLCNDCRISSSLSLPALTQSYNECFLGSSLSRSDPAHGLPLIHAMALSDCANVISCLSRGNPRTQEKSSRLILNSLKDAMSSVNISFVCAPFNISDVGTKVNSTLGIYYRVAETNFYRIGFMSRKECRQVMDSLRPEMTRENGTRENLHINSRSSNK